MKNIVYKIPENDGEIFVHPTMDDIPDTIVANRKRIQEYKFEIAGVPFHELRDKTRKDLVYKAVYYTKGIESLFSKGYRKTNSYVRHGSEDNTLREGGPDNLCFNGLTLSYESIKNIPIIQTGHEPVFYHPGIWIKNHLIHYLSKKLNGIGINMIVDNDACNMGFMYMPVLSKKPASIQKIMLVEDKQKMAYEEIVFDDIGTILRFREEVLSLLRENGSHQRPQATIEHMQEMFEQFINNVIGYYHRGCTDMVGLFTSARGELEKVFSLDNLEIPVSWLCDTDGFYYFLLHILFEASQFSGIYNSKLAEYRHIHKIRSKANPLPDLKKIGNLIEVPFWVWEAGGNRGKCFVVNEDKVIKITNGSDTLIVLKKNEDVIQQVFQLKALNNAGIKIRPRAITATMFSRVFFSDVFIHGIGGAKYDTITDEIIREFFSVDPPSFVTISATLFLPFTMACLDSKNLPHDLREMVYNPERYASEEVKNSTEFIRLAEEKQTVLRMMANGNKNKKRQYFSRIKELNTAMFHKISGEVFKKQERMSELRNNLTYNEVIKFREYPIYIYPMKLLYQYFAHLFSSR